MCQCAYHITKEHKRKGLVERQPFLLRFRDKRFLFIFLLFVAFCGTPQKECQQCYSGPFRSLIVPLPAFHLHAQSGPPCCCLLLYCAITQISIVSYFLDLLISCPVFIWVASAAFWSTGLLLTSDYTENKTKATRVYKLPLNRRGIAGRRERL